MLVPLPTLANLTASSERRSDAATPTILRILVVDDDEAVRHALGRLLRKRGHDVHVCESGVAALARLELEPFEVMRCDDRMPGMSGLELVQRALALDGDLAVLVLSGTNDARAAMSALSQGALDYLVKPIAVPDLDAATARAAHRRQLDIGKIGIREEILNKPDALTAEQYAHVKEHVRIGMDILEPLRHIPQALEYIHDHHERFDGAGYARGKRGIEISIGGRILAACDAFDAMTSRRAYREAFGEKHVIDDLRTHVNRLLGPAVFAALERVVARRRTLTFIDDRHA